MLIGFSSWARQKGAQLKGIGRCYRLPEIKLNFRVDVIFIEGDPFGLIFDIWDVQERLVI